MPAKVKAKDEDFLTLRYVELDTVQSWERNAKRHDTEGIIKSLKKHGFKDPIKYEPTLNNGAGGIVAGNGRLEALQIMRNQAPTKPPRGIMLDGKKWLVPVLFGVDARSTAAAESYGVDHNNLTMTGGELTMPDIMSVWDDSYIGMVRGLQASGELPVSVSASDLDELLEASRERLTEEEQEIRPKTMLRILLSVPASVAVDVIEHIDRIKAIPGVEVDYSGN